MVSLWPWKGEDTSPASFEKTLSALSAKISKSQLQLETLRQRSRRIKALWTLYSSFAYLLCAIVLALVVGWQNWNIWEYTALSGGPVVMYLVRTAIASYYTYRIDSVTSRLEEQQTQRAKTIDKLKAATKYNSTQQLLEKYGGAPPQAPKPKAKGQSPARIPKKVPSSDAPVRTSMGPPATANIQRNHEPPSQPSTPQPMPMRQDIPQIGTPAMHRPLMRQPSQAEFAPNAFLSTPQYDQGDINAGGNWYDRILDLLLGDDETSPKNRMVLICKHCRLVNGQAPPGVKRMEELGKWRCIGCGGWNGELDEGAKIVAEIKEMEQKSLDQPESEDKHDDSAAGSDSKAPEETEADVEASEESDDEQVKEPLSKPKRGRPKGSGKSKA